MRNCPASDCGSSVHDESLRFCPECGSDLDPTSDPLSAPVSDLPLGETILPAVDSRAAAHSPHADPAPSPAPFVPPQVPAAPLALDPPASPPSHPAPQPTAPPTRGASWLRGPLEPVAPPSASNSPAFQSMPPDLSGLGIPAPPSLPAFMTPSSPSSSPAKARLELITELGERIGFLIDTAPELRVGATGSIFVRFERDPTPEQLEIHLHWELEIDGQRISRDTQLLWHSDDWDQDATLGILPTRAGEARLVRLSMALVAKSNPARCVILTVRDVPVPFRVQEPRTTSTIHQHINVTGNANALSIKAEALEPAGSTPASELERRKLRQFLLVPEPNKDWWQRRGHVLGRTHGHRALLRWSGAQGPRMLLVHSHPGAFSLGRQKGTNQFVARWLPCRPGIDAQNELLTRTISRSHLTIELAASQILVRKLSAGTSVARASSSPSLGSGGSTPFVRMKADCITLQRPELLSLGGQASDGSDGLQLKLTPLSAGRYCAVLIERVNNLPQLAYLALATPTRLEPRGSLEGLPRGLTIEAHDGGLELKGPPSCDLHRLGIEFADCDEDAFTE